MRGSRWSHPLTIAVIGGLIALVGTVTAALISSSGGSGGGGAGSQTERSDELAGGTAGSDAGGIAIQTVTFTPRPDGRGVMTVRGVARGLGETDSLYAIAKPRGSAGGQRWFVSDAKTPDRAGRWSAAIRVDRPTRQPLTVVAVQVQGCAPGTACGTPDAEREALESSGPDSSLVDMRSRPFTARD